MGGALTHLGEMGNAYRILVGETEGKRPLGRPRCIWENNIRRDLRATGWDGVDCIHLSIGSSGGLL
jgi:hypothetical protein